MYKLIIVDDETAIRHGMCHYIPWKEMGFEVIADFEDGKETIEYINEHDVDVIITDIEMAEVSGLNLIKYIIDQGLDIKIVILSGYKSFEYARKALEFKVENYLLKPLHMDKVKEVFGKIKMDLDQIKAKEQSDKKEQESFDKLLSELQEQFFISLLVGGVKGEEEILEKCQFLRLDLKMDRPYAVLDLTMNHENSAHISFFQHQDNKQKLLHDMFGTSNGDVDYYIADLSFQVIKVIAVSVRKVEIDIFKQILEAQIREKCQATNQLFKLKVTIKVESIFNNMRELLNYKYTLKVKPIANHNKELIEVKGHKKIVEAYKKLVKIINAGEFNWLKKYIDDMFFEFRKVPLGNLQQLMIDMFSMLASKLMKMDNELWINMLDRINYQDIVACQTREALKILSNDYINDTIDLIDTSRSDVTKRVIVEAMNFIKDNYGEEISLDTIAERYYLNSAYFSRLFKQYLGTTFTDYLIDVRMSEAIKYIKTGHYKMYEISKMVGYNSEKYFFRVFKQYTGYSPAEYYRSKVLQDV